MIPAIHIDDKGQKSASIQVIMNTASDNITYPFDDFAVLAKKPGIRIGKNIFTRDGIILNICTERTTVVCAALYVRVTFIDRRRCLIISNKAQL